MFQLQDKQSKVIAVGVDHSRTVRQSRTAQTGEQRTFDQHQIVAVNSAVSVVPAEHFSAYGGGWVDEISTALIDAVFSIQAQYRSTDPDKGVLNRLQMFRRTESEARNDLSVLSSVGSERIREIMGDSKTARRLKADAVVEAANNFVAEGVVLAEDFLNAEPERMKRVYTQVHGLGWVTFEYFSMLLGVPGVKTDTMILRFVNNALKQAGLPAVDEYGARDLIIESRNELELGETLSHFEHAIWLYESDLSASQRGR